MSCNGLTLQRLEDWESDNTKYALESYDGSITATMITNEFPDEMEIRITNLTDRFNIRGHRSIMDKMTYEDFESKVRLHLERHESLKEIKK